MKTKYTFPAIFSEEDGGYDVSFPDVPEVHTCGDNLDQAIDMAKDALCLMLYSKEEDGETIPEPSDIRNINCENGSFATLINCDTLEYRKFFNNKAVKKTLTIPIWLNALAEREEINFSAVLQEALRTKLGV